MNIDENQKRSHLCRVAEPFIPVDVDPVQRVDGNLFKLSRSFVHGRIEQKRRIEEELPYDGNVSKFSVRSARQREVFREGYDGNFSACPNLPVDVGMLSCYVFHNLPVGLSYQMCQ